VKTSSHLEKLRYVVLGFQTNRQNKDRNASHFDHVALRDIKLYLNSQCYPYGNLNLDITNNHFALLYVMYCRFHTVYYGKEAEPLLSKTEFLNDAPFCRHGLLEAKRIFEHRSGGCAFGFESHANFPAETTAYCLIIHDCEVDYSPLSDDVNKRV